MISIIYLCSTLEQTGPTSQLFNIVAGLDRSSFEPYILTLSPERDNSLKDKFDNAGLEVVCLDTTGEIGFTELEGKIRTFISANNCEIVHSQGIRSDILMSRIVKDSNVGWVATLRNIPYLDYPAQYGRFRGYMMAFLHIMALRRCNKVAVVSQSVKKALQRFFSKPIHVVANGIDTDHYSREKISPENLIELKQSLHLCSNDIVLVYTGVLEERKNILMLLDAIDKCEGFKLILVGDGCLKTHIEKHSAVISNRAIVTGSVKDVRPYLAIADAFVLLSKAEGLPNSVLESLSLDCPVILSDIGPHREIAERAFDMVHIIDIFDTTSLTSFLHDEFHSWRDKISSDKCRDVAVNSFSSLANSLSYQSLYLLEGV